MNFIDPLERVDYKESAFMSKFTVIITISDHKCAMHQQWLRGVVAMIPDGGGCSK